MYCIGTGTQYIAAKSDNYLYATSNADEARLFSTAQRAGNALVTLPRRFYNISTQWSVRQFNEPEETVKPVVAPVQNTKPTIKKQEMVTTEESEVEFDISEFVDVLNIIADLKSKKNGCLTKLNSELSRVNEEILDIEHFIEFSKLNVPNAYNAYKMLRDTLNERRRIKDAITAATELYNNCDVDKLAESRDTLNNRHYNPRRLPGLFK